MNPAHLHLLINHLPIMGAFLALPLLVLAFVRAQDRGAMYAAGTVLVLAAGGAVGAQLTGEPAEEVVEDIPTVSQPWIEEHEERAETATVIAVITGIGALGLMAFTARAGAAPRVGIAVVGVAAVLEAGAMAWTGQAGGLIRHTEFRDGAGPLSGGASVPVAEGRQDNDEDDD